jgi:transposase
MLSLSPSVKIFVCREACDMRRSFDGLARMVEAHVGGDPLSGALFVFRNRRGDRLKILCWHGDGYVILYKRLERGVFYLPEGRAGAIRPAELSMILDGVDVSSVRRHPRYQRPA